MNWPLLALALAPGILIMWWIYWQDRYEKEPIWVIIRCFLAGAVVTVPVIYANLWWTSQGFGVSEQLVPTAFYAFISVGATEELAKLLMVLLFAYSAKSFNEPFDGIVYSVSVAMGFATAENVIYLFVNSNGVDAFWVGLIRAFTALPAHATFAILMGFFLGISKFRVEKIAFILMGWLMAVLFHGAYDFFLFLNHIPGISLGALISLVVGVGLAKRAIRLNNHISPFKNEETGYPEA